MAHARDSQQWLGKQRQDQSTARHVGIASLTNQLDTQTLTVNMRAGTSHTFFGQAPDRPTQRLVGRPDTRIYCSRGDSRTLDCVSVQSFTPIPTPISHGSRFALPNFEPASFTVVDKKIFFRSTFRKNPCVPIGMSAPA